MSALNRDIWDFLRRHDGQAVTCDDFIKAMEDMGTTKIGDFPLVYGPGNHNGSNFVDLEMYTRSGSLRR